MRIWPIFAFFNFAFFSSAIFSFLKVRNLLNFYASSRKSKFALWCATFVENILCLSQKSTEELCVITLKNDANFEEELACALPNDKINLTNFDSTLEILKVCTLKGSFQAKYIMSELKNYTGITCHDTELWCNI